MKKSFLPLVCLSLTACGHTPPQGNNVVPTHSQEIIQPKGTTISSRILPPAGYYRIPEMEESLGTYLRRQLLKPNGAPVLYYDGREKPNPNIYAAVLSMDIGHEDLQQCADAVMRLHAEYLYHAGKKALIHFNFTSGFYADYTHWIQGSRINIAGNNVKWVAGNAADTTYRSFRKYLDKVFSFAGTLSLSKELQPVAYKDMKIGDILIVGGTPGHAVTIMDMAVNTAGKKLYLLAQSYMPAQDIQVLENPVNPGISPWYELDTTERIILTPQWDFKTTNLMRFKD